MLASCMNDRARAASAEYALSSRLATEWTHNQADVYALDEEDLIRTWISTQQASGFSDEQVFARFEELTGDPSLTLGEHGFEFVNLYAATAINAGRDSRTLAALGRDMQRSGNIWGRFDIRLHNGRHYIIFKGNHRLRQVVRGTRYALSNPTIIKMGIGTDGLKGAAKGGVFVTLLVSVSVNIYAWIFHESVGWTDFLKNVSLDLVKAAIAAVAGYFVAKSVAALGGMVVLANFSGLVFVLGIGVGIAPIKWHDISTFAEKSAHLYRQSLGTLSSPSAFISTQRRRVSDFAYCVAEVTGHVAITAVQQEIETRVKRALWRLSPLNIR